MKVFRSVKLWEWNVGECLLLDCCLTAATQLNQTAGARGSQSQLANAVNLSQVVRLDSTDMLMHEGKTQPFDYTVSLGNLSLTAWYVLTSLF